MQTQLKKQVKVTEESWNKKKETINNWLLGRHKMLSAYCDLAGVDPEHSKNNTLPEEAQVKHFCQILMDYVSAGHFEIFELVLNECQRNNLMHAITANELCSKIFTSTDFALHFNDKYANEISEEHLNEFDNNLSMLGKHIERRFELEDKLISPVQSDHTGSLSA